MLVFASCCTNLRPAARSGPGPACSCGSMAERLIQARLEARRKSLPPNHPSILSTLVNLSHLTYMKGEYGRALTLYEEALAIQRNTPGVDVAVLARDINNLGLLYYLNARYAPAIALLQEALDLARRALPEGHHVTIVTLNNMGLVYKAKNETSQATWAYTEALRLRRMTLPEHHPDIATTLTNLGVALVMRGEHAKVRRMAECWARRVGEVG